MANVDKAFGLRPYKGLNVGSAVQEANKYSIDPSGYGTSIFQGDWLYSQADILIEQQLLQLT